MMTRHPYINGIDNVSQPDMVCVNLSMDGYDELNAISYVIRAENGGYVEWTDLDFGEQKIAVGEIGSLLKNPENAISLIENKRNELLSA